MKNFTSSVFFKKNNIWVIPVPTFMCNCINLISGGFKANLFIHDVREEDNKYEIVVSPFSREDMDFIYRMRMRLGNGIGTTHKMLELLKSHDTFNLDVKVIDGIEAASQDSGEVGVIGKIEMNAPFSKYLTGPICIYKINQEINEREESRGRDWMRKFPPLPILFLESNRRKQERIEDFRIPEYPFLQDISRFPLLVEKCFDRMIYPKLQDSIYVDIEKHFIDFPVNFATDNRDGFNYLIFPEELFASIFHVPTNASMEYSFVSIRLDEERSSLAIILKPPKEKLFNFRVKLAEHSNINKLTDVLSNVLQVNFRSVASVCYGDGSVEVRIAPNVSDSRLKNIHPYLLDKYFEIKNMDFGLNILQSDNYVYSFKFGENEFPTPEEMSHMFCVQYMGIGYQNTYYMESTHKGKKPPEILELGNGLQIFAKDICAELTNDKPLNDEGLRRKVADIAVNLKGDLVVQSVDLDYPISIRLIQNKKFNWLVYIRYDSYLLLCFSGILRTQGIDHPNDKIEEMINLISNNFRAMTIIDEQKLKEKWFDNFNSYLYYLIESKEFAKMKCVANRYYYIEKTPKAGKSGGQVYPAIDEHKTDGKGQIRAVKVTETEPTLVEVKTILMHFDHPNVLKYLDFEREANKWTIVMEYLNGCTLQEIIEGQGQEKGLDLEQIKDHAIIKGILDGVKYLHQKKILHLDLKLDNIMIAKNTKGICAKILDYGLSGFKKDAKYSPSVSKRNAEFMAPELVKASFQELDDWTDIFSLGVIFSKIYFNRHPYDNYAQFVENPKSIYRPIYSFPVSSQSKLLVDVIKKACAWNTSTRYKNIDEFQNDLLRAL